MLTNQETLLGRGTLVGAFPGGSVVKNPPANAGDVGLIPGSGRSSGEEIAKFARFHLFSDFLQSL